MDAGRGERLLVPGEAFAERAAALVAERLRAVIESSGDLATLALSGGSTPAPVYEALARLPGIAWDRVAVYFGDERCVPPDHPESNFRLARERLLERLPCSPAAVHRMEGDAEDREAAARRYEALLPERLDLLLLGVGEDGHTASLFPGEAAAEERARRVLPARAPTSPRARLTLTPPVLAAARRVIVLARGRAKASAVARALEGDEPARRCPARLARRGTWILDPEAAARLRAGGGTP